VTSGSTDDLARVLGYVDAVDPADRVREVAADLVLVTCWTAAFCAAVVRAVSATVRLNDGYDGAELRFPRQRYDNSAQPVGSMLAWPSLVTHPHETAPLRAGVKYGLTVWFELPSDATMF
jgi:hypothetical protein